LVNGNAVSPTSQYAVETGTQGASKTLEEMQTQATYEELEWDFTDVWAMDTETNFPVLKWMIPEEGGVNIREIAPATFRTSFTGTTLKITGLSTGQPLKIYNAQGALIYNAITRQAEVNLPISLPGVYIVKAGGTSVKVMR
jgi:hypothetical protein